MSTRGGNPPAWLADRETMRRHVVLLWVASVAIAGCPDDGAAVGDAGSSSSSTGDGDPSAPGESVDPDDGSSSAGGQPESSGDPPDEATTSSPMDTSTSDTSTSSVEGSSSTGAPIECPDLDLGSDATVTEIGTNEGAGDEWAGSCGGGLSEEVVVQWTAPADGHWRIATFGSDYDTLLYVLDGCGGDELGCNDDASGLASAIEVDATAGQVLAIVIDGYDAGSIGTYTLSITQPLCTPQDVGSDAPFAGVGTTVEGGDDVYSPCGGGGAPDVEILWTAPVASNYAISTAGSGFDTVLSVFESDCAGELWSCNDDAELAVAGRSEVVLTLEADAALLVAVDGALGQSGDYALAITDLGPYAGDCCSVHPEIGCDDTDVASCVCSVVPQCCTGAWDQICVGVDNLSCGGTCALTPGGSCCETSDAPGCDVPEIEACVCEVFPGCCDDAWTSDCAEIATFACAAEC